MTFQRSKLVGALITARGGSKGLPGKNVRLFAGKPLIVHTIEAAQQAKLVNSIYLSSDDPEIISVAQNHGCLAPFVRDASLGTDIATSLDVVLDALDRLPYHNVWVLLQPTSPLRTAEDIDAVVEPVLQGVSECCVAVRPAEDHPYLCYQPYTDGRLRPFCTQAAGASSRRQDLPQAVTVNGAAYAFTSKWIRRNRKFVGRGSRFHIMPPERSQDIDTITDFANAERAMLLLNPAAVP